MCNLRCHTNAGHIEIGPRGVWLGGTAMANHYG